MAIAKFFLVLTMELVICLSTYYYLKVRFLILDRGIGNLLETLSDLAWPGHLVPVAAVTERALVMASSDECSTADGQVMPLCQQRRASDKAATAPSASFLAVSLSLPLSSFPRRRFARRVYAHAFRFVAVTVSEAWPLRLRCSRG